MSIGFKCKDSSAGVDSVSLEDYEKDLVNRLYKLWNRRQAESNIKLALNIAEARRRKSRRLNRMSSGSYMPNAVRLVEIPKPGGGKRPLGISKFFDTIDHALLMKAVECHVREKWVLLYIRR